MSYDCYMEIDTGGKYRATVADIGNMTSNVSPMWTKAIGRRLSECEGMTGADLAPLLEAAIADMDDPSRRREYEALSPANGWGSVLGARDYLYDILVACREHPKAVFHASH